MQTRTLGRNGPVVSALGLGCMGMSAFYGGRGDDAAAIAVIHRALERGVTLLDTAHAEGRITADCQFCGAHYVLDPATVGLSAQAAAHGG